MSVRPTALPARISSVLFAVACAACGPEEETASGQTPGSTTAGTAGWASSAGNQAPVTSNPQGACDATRDADVDGVPDCMDECPGDRAKSKSGVCGCGTAETDSDADGTPDCKDGCPRDAASAPPLGSRCSVASGSAGMGALPPGGPRPAGAGPAPAPMPMPTPMPAPTPAAAGAAAPPPMAGPMGACPAGFESDLPLVMTGATVPGNLELGLASAPETPRNPCGLPEEQECFMLLNAERAAAGRTPLRWDGDLVDLARSHSADRVQKRYPGTMHGSSTSDTHLYEQRGAFVGLKKGKFTNVVENALTGSRTAASAVKGWMSSSGHKAVILGDGQWSSFTHAGCGRDGSEWNIEFGR